MLTTIISQGAKFVSKFSKAFNLGNGSTWPGHIALALDANIISHLLQTSNVQTILVVGTNGKTTTGKMLATILEESGKKVIQNTSGANLLNGIASSLLLHTNHHGVLSADYAVFEVDENNLPLVLSHVTPKVIIALNLFRDQLDRYGELDSIAKKWNSSMKNLTENTTLVLNSDDPLIAYVAKEARAKVVYFGLNDEIKGTKTLQHGADSVYCPNCGHKLDYKKVFYSHLGIWSCPSCKVKRPLPYFQNVTSPLPGLYNTYNTYASALAAHELDISQATIEQGLQKVLPAFGRQEKVTVDGKKVQIFLSKNPISMNESLRTITELSRYSSSDLPAGEESRSSYHVIPAKAGIHGSRINPGMTKPTVLFALNDRIPDGLDVSWIWDINMEEYVTMFDKVFISGDRVYDMALRFEYAQTKNEKRKTKNTNYFIEPKLETAIRKALEQLSPGETLFILPTYSAMLEVRKILTGKKIL